MVSASTSAPYGRRLLPSLLDDIAREDPTRVLFYTPRNDQPSQGYDVVTAFRFSNSVNNLCWWLESHLGSGAGPKTIGYIGQNDLRYFLMMMAAAKVGHKLLLSSPRNSIEGHRSLIKASGCELWITTTGIDNVDFIQTLGLPHIKVPELSELINIEPVEPYIYTKTWEQGRNDVFALLHTSGSTGLPKLVPVYLGTAASIDAFHLMQPIEGNMPAGVAWTGIRMLCAMPLFHVAGICLGLFSALFFRWSVALPSTGPIMQHVIEAALDNIQLDSAFISPSVLQDISKTPRVLDKLSKLKFISSAGGPVTQSVGDVIHPRVPIHQTMGMTEAQWLASVVTHPDEWAYFRFHPETGYEMRPYSDGMYELAFVKRKELSLTQPVFVTFPNLDSWETKDLWTPHPTIPDLWKYQMRRDDLIVLSNGEKFNPLGAEGKIMGHPKIAAAVITGRARFQAAALLLPTDQHIRDTDGDLIDAVWPTVEIANKELPAHAQIHRAFVKIVRTPFPRTPKGSLARNEAEKAFADTIDEIYKTVADTDTVSFVLDASSLDSIRAGIREAIHTVSGIDGLGDDDSIFTRGFDSLNVIRLVRLLKSAFNPPIPIENDAIYINPSISTLSHALLALLHHGPSDHVTMTDTILSTFAKFSNSFEGSRQVKEHVVITGTSGSVGPYLLDALCKSDRVATVWCLNRSSDGERRQIQLARSKGLTTDWSAKAKFLQLDLASQTLGLRGADLETIKDQATVIIHNAWEVNFHLPLPSFEPHLAGLQNLVGVCRETRHRVKFFFISSIGTAGNWPTGLLGPVPETAIRNLESPINGYGASKLVAEHLLSRAAQSGILNLSVLRVGQVAGPIRSDESGGEWTRRDWLPAIIDASVYIKALPSDLGSANTLDWIPVDLLAEVTTELVHTDRHTEPDETFYNLLNPRTSNWQDIVPHIQARLTTTLSKVVRVVSFKDWIDLLRNAEDKIASDTGTATNGTLAGAKNAEAGLKLLSFFESLASVVVEAGLLDNGTRSGPNTGRQVQWATNNAMLQSSTFAGMTPVSTVWFDRWLDQWGY